MPIGERWLQYTVPSRQASTALDLYIRVSCRNYVFSCVPHSAPLTLRTAVTHDALFPSRTGAARGGILALLLSRVNECG